MSHPLTPNITDLDTEVARALRDDLYSWGLTLTHRDFGDIAVNGRVVNEKAFALVSSSLRACLHAGDYKLVKRELM